MAQRFPCAEIPTWCRIHMLTQEMRVWSLGQEDPLEKEMATHSSTFAWEIPCSGSMGYSPQGCKRVGHDWATEHADACALKDIIRKWKDSLQNGRKYLQIMYLTGVWYRANIYRTLITQQLKDNLIKNGQRTRIDIPPKIYKWSASAGCSTSPINREMQNKTFIPTRKATTTTIIINLMENNKRSWNPLFIAGRSVKWFSFMESCLTIPQKVKNRISIWFSNSAPRYIPQRTENRYSNKHMYTRF